MNKSIQDQYIKMINIIYQKIKIDNILLYKKYIIAATTFKLIENNIVVFSNGNDQHAESILIDLHKDIIDDNIWIIRLYNNFTIGSGLPCQQCVDKLRKNKVKNIYFSINNNLYSNLDINKSTTTYTTTGYKLLNIDKYLYDDYLLKKRKRI